MRRWTGCWQRQEAIENALAARHLSNGTLVLYDVSSAAFEGHTCPLGEIGHPRDGVKGRLQIVYGLLCSPAGVPIAIEVFEGNTADPKTLAAQINKLKTRFGLSRVCLVGDRGMLTSARISAELRPARLDWISALRAPQIKSPRSRPARCSCRCSTSRTSSRSSPRTSPGSGWCAATTRSWPRSGPANATSCWRPPKKSWTTSPRPPAASSRPLRGKDKIALRVGKVINHYKMAKHFTLEITEDSFTLHPQPGRHRRRGRPRRHLRAAHQPARRHPRPRPMWWPRYKDLADVERFFRTLNSELDVRPIRHRLADRVRAHMFLRMLSYYISWHMKQALAPILFQDNDKPAAAAKRANPVAAAQRSDQHSGQSRAQTHRRRHPGAQLHQPAGRPGHHLRQPDPAHRRHAGIHHDHHPHPAAAASLRTPRHLPPPRLGVVSTPTPATPQNPSSTPQPVNKPGGASLFVKRLSRIDCWVCRGGDVRRRSWFARAGWIGVV